MKASLHDVAYARDQLLEFLANWVAQANAAGDFTPEVKEQQEAQRTEHTEALQSTRPAKSWWLLVARLAGRAVGRLSI